MAPAKKMDNKMAKGAWCHTTCHGWPYLKYVMKFTDGSKGMGKTF